MLSANFLSFYCKIMNTEYFLVQFRDLMKYLNHLRPQASVAGKPEVAADGGQ